jgi:hypothetical protein
VVGFALAVVCHVTVAGSVSGSNGLLGTISKQGVKLLGLLLAGSTGRQEQVEMGWPDIHG